MSKYRNCLPRLGKNLFLTDGGLETILVFLERLDLPCFAAFDLLKDEAGSWRQRIRGLRANASRRSHAELDESTDLDAGNPLELGGEYRQLRRQLPHLTVLGGCCGTDHRHVDAIFAACA